jgi:general secretion pathway protein G
MNGSQPPPMPTKPARKSGMPTWAIVLIVVGIVGFVGIAGIGMLAAIAIPNFVKARTTAQMNACINNLRQIDGAKQQWALENNKDQTDTPKESDIAPYFKDHRMPVCAAGGIYTINAVDEPPTCSIPDHKLPAR